MKLLADFKVKGHCEYYHIMYYNPSSQSYIHHTHYLDIHLISTASPTPSPLHPQPHLHYIPNPISTTSPTPSPLHPQPYLHYISNHISTTSPTILHCISTASPPPSPTPSPTLSPPITPIYRTFSSNRGISTRSSSHNH